MHLYYAANEIKKKCDIMSLRGVLLPVLYRLHYPFPFYKNAVQPRQHKKGHEAFSVCWKMIVVTEIINMTNRADFLTGFSPI